MLGKRKFGAYKKYNSTTTPVRARKQYKGGFYQSRARALAPTRGIIRYQQTHQGGEIKSVDILGPTASTTQTPFTLNSTAQLTVLNPITIGSSMWNRIGRKISLKSIHLQGFIRNTPSPAIVDNYIRIMIVYDKQSNGALPSIADVIQGQVNGPADVASNTIYDGMNLNNRDRFEIIKDTRILGPMYTVGTATVPSTVGVTSACSFDTISAYIKLNGRETHYKADTSTGVVGDIATGSLFLITWGNIAPGSEPYQLNATLRLRYSDL